MNDITRINEHHPANAPQPLIPLPSPASLGVRVREARPEDIDFIDALQKTHSKAVGWMPTGQLEGHIARGHVLVAEAPGSQGTGNGDQGPGGYKSAGVTTDYTDIADSEQNQLNQNPVPSGQSVVNPALMSSHPGPQSLIPAPGSSPSAQPKLPGVGYCIGVDKYFKREDTGIIYQMNITPGRQRGLVGATLLQAMFDRWPYGVRLCCCWCAQDLAANKFWEAMGFVPLAFRAGSRRRGSGGRVHIFWQKQVRRQGTGVRDRGSVTTDCADGSDSGQRILNPAPSAQSVVNPALRSSHPDPRSLNPEPSCYWFPSQTGSGALREDRIVLPIPPGTHWSDAKPRIYPEVSGLIEAASQNRKAIEQETRKEKEKQSKAQRAVEQARMEAAKAQAATVAAGGLRFASGGGDQGSGNGEKIEGRSEKIEGTKQKSPDQGSPLKAHTSRGKPKNDPRLVAAARELRDRWLEYAAAHPGLLEQGNTAARRYDVGRALESATSAMDALQGPMEQLRLPAEPGDQKAA